MASAASFDVTSAMCSWCWCASLPVADMMLRLTRLWESAPLAADLLGLGRGDLREDGGGGGGGVSWGAGHDGFLGQGRAGQQVTAAETRSRSC